MSSQQIPVHLKAALVVEEAAALVSTSKNTIYQAIDSGQLAYFRIGRKIVIRRKSLEKWMKAKDKLVTDAHFEMPVSVPNNTTQLEARNL